MSRRYATIWKQLKDTAQCKIAVPMALHSRVIRAVKKEKDKDLGYKVLLAENAQSARLSIKTEGAMITFKLNKSIGLDGL